MGMRWKKTVTTAKHLLNIYLVSKLLFWFGGRSFEARGRTLNFSCNTDRWCDLQKVIFSEPQFPDLENGGNNQGHWMDAKYVMSSQYEPLSLRLLVLIPHDFFGVLVHLLSS